MPPSELTTEQLDFAPTVAHTSAELVVLHGADAGMRWRLAPGTVRVGTAHGNDVCLNDPTVSRLHCEIHVGPEAIRVIDLESTNGTHVNGVRVRDATLPAGAALGLGETVVRLDPSSPTSVELSPVGRFGAVLGGSMQMRRLYRVLDRAAETDATVLLRGETGTGKEIVARSLHEASRRASGPFVTIDCGSIAETLIESELFGHVRGAFSNAIRERVGLIEEANGGTLFLDEIGELPRALQSKLLRVLETREVRRVGSNAVRQVDVRVVAATHRPLALSVNSGAFREDLYYRLAVIEVELPPLRARAEDIPALAQHFHARFTGRADPLPASFTSALMQRAWPGNVRELRNFIERSASLGWSQAADVPALEQPKDEQKAPVGLESLVPADLPLRDAREQWNEQFERLYASALLRRTQGNVTRAAALANVTRRSFQRMIAQRGLRSQADEADAGIDDGE
jgi:DNA-binding NtrC family response regulator